MGNPHFQVVAPNVRFVSAARIQRRRRLPPPVPRRAAKNRARATRALSAPRLSLSLSPHAFRLRSETPL